MDEMKYDIDEALGRLTVMSHKPELLSDDALGNLVKGNAEMIKMVANLIQGNTIKHDMMVAAQAKFETELLKRHKSPLNG